MSVDTQTLRLGRESRWRVGSPAKLRAGDKWVDARIIDVKPSDDKSHNSDTHAVFELSLRTADGVERNAHINVNHATPLEDSFTHEIVDVVTNNAGIPHKATDGAHFLKNVHTMMSESHDHIDVRAMQQVAHRLLGMGVISTDNPSIAEMKAAINSRLTSLTVAAPSKDSCGCHSSKGHCGCAPDCDCGRSCYQRKSRSAATMDMQALAAVLEGDAWATANASMMAAGFK
jgi:hypothetical protein